MATSSTRLKRPLQRHSTGLDIAFFAGTEGEKGASQLFGWEAVKRGCFVVDNGDDYRMGRPGPAGRS